VNLADLIRERLAPLAPATLEIFDDSAEHAGHAGVLESGGGHFEVLLVSPAFAGKSAVARHRMVYQAVADLIPHRVHALAIRAYAPGELEGTVAR
jgi:BolA family transcriptional regulator, general stress-responsive regulator